MSKTIPTNTSPTWRDVPYLETTDRVIGGIAGSSNLSAVALAERTDYIKERLDTVVSEASSAAVIAATEATEDSLDTLITVAATQAGDAATASAILAVGTVAEQAALDVETRLVNQLALGTGASAIGNTPTGSIAATTVQGAINEIVSDLAASSGASLVGYLPAGTGAVASTVQAKLRESVSVLDFGADPTGATDSVGAFLLACSYATSAKIELDASGGAWLFSSTLALTTAHNGLKINLHGATILKGFNGTLCTVTGTVRLSVIGRGIIDGQQATYTGKGFVFSGASHYPVMDCFFYNFPSAAVEFGADAGFRVSLRGSIFRNDTTTVTAISCTGPDTTAMFRDFSGVSANGSIDLVGTRDTCMVGGYATAVNISATCGITVVQGVTMSTAGVPITFDGLSTFIIGCRIAGDVTLAASMTGVYVGNDQTAGTFTNSTVSGNVTVINEAITYLQNGLTTAPSLTFSGDADTGLWRRTANVIDVVTGGNTCTEFQNNRLAIGSGTPLSWTDTTTIPTAGAYDTSLFRSAAGAVVVGVGGSLTASIGSIHGKLYPRDHTGGQQLVTGVLGGSGAPDNANGSNGDFYFRSDGGALTTIYHKRVGAWVGVV